MWTVYLLIVGSTFVQPLDTFVNVSFIFNVKLHFYIFYRKPDHSHNAVVRSYRFLGCTRCLLGQNKLSLVWSPWEVIEHLRHHSRLGVEWVTRQSLLGFGVCMSKSYIFEVIFQLLYFWIHLCELKCELAGCSVSHLVCRGNGDNQPSVLQGRFMRRI